MEKKERNSPFRVVFLPLNQQFFFVFKCKHKKKYWNGRLRARAHFLQLMHTHTHIHPERERERVRKSTINRVLKVKWVPFAAVICYGLYLFTDLPTRCIHLLMNKFPSECPWNGQKISEAKWNAISDLFHFLSPHILTPSSVSNAKEAITLKWCVHILICMQKTGWGGSN